MIKDFSVDTCFINKGSGTSVIKNYPFAQYVDTISSDIIKTISDVEEAFSKMNNGKAKESWSFETNEYFKKIRHNLLNQANKIKRLPDSLKYKDKLCNSIDLNEFIVGLLNGGN